MIPVSRRKRKIPIPLPVKIFLISITPLLLGAIIWGLYQFTHKSGVGENSPDEISRLAQAYRTIEIEEDFLTPNEYSRPQTALKKVNDIVIHYTANPNSDAKANRDYFESLKDTKITSASSHFIVGLEGNIIQCIPLNEISYASNDRNSDTISIECCHPDKSGKLNKKTYHSLIHLCVYLCRVFSLSEENLIRHYDVTGKLCPKYYVKHPKKWEELKSETGALLEYYN